MVGVTGFEPATSSSRTKRASQAALYPDRREAAKLGQSALDVKHDH